MMKVVIHNSYNNAGGFQTPTTTAVMVGRVPNIISHNYQSKYLSIKIGEGGGYFFPLNSF